MRTAREEQAAWPFPFGPLVYQAASGATGPDPDGLLGPSPRYSPAKLAAYFAGPALYRDFRPDCPWAGVRLFRPPPPEPGGGGSVAAFGTAFHDAVRRAMDGHDRIAVALSGGMDSAAVLYAASEIARQDGRQVVAVVLDVTDDEGRRASEVARGVMAALGVESPLAVVPDDDEQRWPEPEWTARGPRFDAKPRLHRALAGTAAAHGGQVLLHGLGADQLIAAPRYLARPLLAARGLRAASRYLRDRRAERDLGAELAALGCGRLRAGVMMTGYLALARKDLCEPVSPVLTEEAAAAARDWLSGTVAAALAAHEHRSWAAADAVDRVFPMDPIEPGTELPELAPFLDPDVAASAWRLPLTDRYDDGLTAPYFRRKALTLGLLPAGVRPALVAHRQRGYGSYSRYWQRADPAAPRLEALGLVRPDWRARCRSAFDAAMVHACEQWLAGADERGAGPDDTRTD